MRQLQVAFYSYGPDFKAWDDESIRAGAQFTAEILKAVDPAAAALRLVSADSLTSEYILEKEVPRLLERREKEGLPVVPVILKPCAWQRVDWLKSMEVRPKKGALSSLGSSEVEAILASIATELADMLGSPKPIAEPLAAWMPNPTPAPRSGLPRPMLVPSYRQEAPLTAQLGLPFIYHNVMRNNINCMEILLSGSILNAGGRSAQLAVHFFGPTGQPLFANVQERFYRDAAGAGCTHSPAFPVPGDSYELPEIRLVIPYDALNLMPTGMAMAYNLTAVANLYMDGAAVTQPLPAVLTVRF